MLSISTMLKEDHFNQEKFNDNEIYVQKEDAINYAKENFATDVFPDNFNQGGNNAGKNDLQVSQIVEDHVEPFQREPVQPYPSLASQPENMMNNHI